MASAGEPLLVRLYGNRRLYQPALGRYVTIEGLTMRARQGAGIVVQDAATGDDITQLILDPRPTEH